MKSKFANINFPLFGLRRKPNNVKYLYDKLYIQKGGSNLWKIADDLSLEGEYLDRLSQLDLSHRLIFEMTALNLQQLLLQRPKWGIDKTGKIFDFKPVQKFDTKSIDIERKKGKLIWLKKISYPFELPEHLQDVEIRKLKELYFRVVYIDKVWYLLSVGYASQKRNFTFI